MTFINYDGVVTVTVEEDCMYDILGEDAYRLLNLDVSIPPVSIAPNPYMTHSKENFIEYHLNHA